ncbi:SEC-C metal-binding domain-containing protein [Sulfitobacter pontiacus]|jgi:hypothetical protein|uniref:SEC-C metal-binding domain-containing protein n=1 Tax=Sulfitobacter pontiacus TaxID=60137 RepID=UPI00241C8C77|nr:SEC-C metal-binding domain-containing protein [Sulfitobacter pontiacus]HJO52846.1 SEC-C metal-binding domain-containing protein [Sulfitobacter pontiacus]|tara:strand:- start:886 stop:2055 length:1170 start_codon:yes stop_codon:yes gene_type:complete
MRHPSLFAPKLALSHNRLSPVEKMGRNEQCWCRSGKKFKYCHLVREALEPVNAFEQEQRMFQELREGYCSLPKTDSCSSKISKAHTIQRKGGLAAISENNHVLTVKPRMKDMILTGGNPQPRRIGLKDASVFPGFCSKHDSELFKPIEGKSLDLDAQSAFLFSYRAIAYERYAKEAEGRFNIIMREDVDRGQPFWKQSAMQSLLYDVSIGIELGKSDMNRVKVSFDDILLSDSFEGFHYCAIRFDRIIPVVACCAFHPEFDLDGTRLQRLGQDTVELDAVTLTVTVFEGASIAIFGWAGPDKGPARLLSESLLSIDNDRKADALIRLLFIHSDNIFLKPSWWDALNDKQKTALNNMTRGGTTMRERSAAEYKDISLDLVEAEVLETVTE